MFLVVNVKKCSHFPIESDGFEINQRKKEIQYQFDVQTSMTEAERGDNKPTSPDKHSTMPYHTQVHLNKCTYGFLWTSGVTLWAVHVFAPSLGQSDSKARVPDHVEVG